jgi:sulfopropanediol 3-dehydrogenase
MTPEASVKIGEVTGRQCNVEKMLAHGITAKIRVEIYRK